MERKQTTLWLTAILVFSVVNLIVAVRVDAAIDILEFDSLQQEQQYQDLIDELRCLVCQNQNLADSNAGLAQDLRERTYQMVRSGKSDDEIVDYMVERYGEFVMYRPPLRTSTYLLWFGPVIFLVLAGVTAALYTRRMRDKKAVKLSPEERRKAQQLLDE